MAQAKPRVARPAPAASLYPCPKCTRMFSSRGWVRWHYCKEHCEFLAVNAASAAGDPDKYIKGRYGHMVQR